jgi:hypothetical protein
MRHLVFVRDKTNPSELREVEAAPLGRGSFRLTGPVDSSLQFGRGEIVECSIAKLPDGTSALVATNSLSSDPEYRMRRTVYAVLGGIVGAILGTWAGLETYQTSRSGLIGAAVGTILFSYSSARWGDRAWEVLRRVI